MRNNYWKFYEAEEEWNLWSPVWKIDLIDWLALEYLVTFIVEMVLFKTSHNLANFENIDISLFLNLSSWCLFDPSLSLLRTQAYAAAYLAVSGRIRPCLPLWLEGTLPEGGFCWSIFIGIPPATF